MKLAVRHHTDYVYQGSVSRSTQYIRLTPYSNRYQTVHQWQLDLPADAPTASDAYGNTVHVMTLDYPHDRIAILARGIVEISGKDEVEDNSLRPMYFLRETTLTRPDTAIRAFAIESFKGDDLWEDLEKMMHRLLEQMPYTPGSTLVNEPAAVSFARGRGVCQDHTHVFLACCRSLGVPARYVSGYLHASDDDEHVSSHAWAEAWVGDRWRTFDVTNGFTRPKRHLKLAIGLDYLEACPVRGVRRGGEGESMNSHAAVTLVESPHVDEPQQAQQQQQ